MTTLFEVTARRLIIGLGVAALAVAAMITLVRSDSPPVTPQPQPQPLPAPPSAAAPPPNAEPAPAAAPVPSAGTLRLYGVTGAGAIIGDAGGAQRLVAVGRDVMPGLRLEQVHIDHALLRSSAGTVRLDFAGAAGVPQVRQPAAAPAPAAGAGDTLPYRLGLAPRRQGGQVTGHVVRAGASLPPLERAGIRPGDVILAVNGSRLDEERMLELPWTLRNSDGVTFEIERGGRRMRLESRRAE